jgi:hypothetical protein
MIGASLHAAIQADSGAKRKSGYFFFLSMPESC